MLVAGGVLALSKTAPRRAGSNGVPPVTAVVDAPPGGHFCQHGETVPAGTGAVRPFMAPSEPGGGPQVNMTLSQRGRVISRTQVPPGWSGTSLGIPIPRTTRDYGDVDICFDVAGYVAAIGGETPPDGRPATFGGSTVGGSIRIDYHRPGAESWWSYAPTVLERMGRGRGSWGGTWIAGLVVVLLLASWGLAGRVVARTILEDAPASAKTIALIGLLNAVAWSLITPVFMVPDEIGHVAYAQIVGEYGRPPTARPSTIYAPELEATMRVVRSGTPELAVADAKVWTALEERRLERTLEASLSRRGNGDAGPVNPEPPLYYALEAIPYSVAQGAILPTRIAAMRLLSAAMAAATALFVFLFVRECLPGRQWAWSVGGLGAAFVPMFGFISGGVNPDALLFAVSAALFYCLARAFRRGLTVRLALCAGAVIGLGMVTKLNFYGLAPGALVTLVLAARHSEGAWNLRVAKLVAAVLATSLSSYGLMLGVEALAWDRPLLGETFTDAQPLSERLLDQLRIAWQIYLPPLPGQADMFPGYPGYDLWFKTFVGAFGWVKLTFPAWAYRVAVGVVVVLAALVVRALVVGRAQVRRRWLELLGYLVMVVNLLALIAALVVRGGAPGLAAAAQGRYLLPLLALLGAVLALAARGAGDRWGRAAGVAIVVGAVGWSFGGQLVTIVGFYS